MEEVITKEKPYMSTSVRDQSIEGVAKDISLTLGQGGAEYVTDGNIRNGTFGAIQALTEAQLSELVAGNWSGTTAGIILPAGATIFGDFTSFTLLYGRVVAYRSV